MQKINYDYYYSTVQYNMYLSSFMNLKPGSIDKYVYESILGCLNHSIHKLYKLKGTLG